MSAQLIQIGEKKLTKTDGKCNKQKIQCCFVEYQIYFTSKAEFCDIFTSALNVI